MTMHPVLDAEELARALDVAALEDLVAALARRAERLCAQSEAAYDELTTASSDGRRMELLRRCSTAANLVGKLADAVEALSSGTEQARRVAAFARVAENFRGYACDLLRRPERCGHA